MNKDLPRTVVIVTAGERTPAGHIYPKAELEKLVGRGVVIGEFGSPPRGKAFREYAQIDIERSSHLVSNFRMDGDKLVANVETMGPFKESLDRLLEMEPSPVRFGLRGLCNIGADGTVSDYQLISVDAIAA